MKFGLLTLFLVFFLPSVSGPSPHARSSSSSRRSTSLPGPLHLVRRAFSTNRAWLSMRTAHSEPTILRTDWDLTRWPTPGTRETGGH